MQANIITFQLATHYLTKIALRIECLYHAIFEACKESHPMMHHYALKNMIEILQLIEKPELKSRFLKELMRIEHRSAQSNMSIPTELSNTLHSQIQILTHIAGLFGEGIHQDPFLQIFRQNTALANQEHDMHPPQLIYWLESKSHHRQATLKGWLANLHVLYVTILLYLKLLRSTAEFNSIPMAHGFYQSPLPLKTSCHLILLRVDKSFGIVPKIQLGHHGLSLRLCEADSLKEIKETNACLDLAICQV